MKRDWCRDGPLVGESDRNVRSPFDFKGRPLNLAVFRIAQKHSRGLSVQSRASLTRPSLTRSPTNAFFKAAANVRRADLLPRRTIDRRTHARGRTARIEVTRKLACLRRRRDGSRLREREIGDVRRNALARATPLLKRIERCRRRAGVVSEIDRGGRLFERRRRREDRRRANVATRSGRTSARRNQPNGCCQRCNEETMRQTHEAYFESITRRCASFARNLTIARSPKPLVS